MKLKISAATARFAELPWPEDVPLPPINSEVAMMHDGQRISFVVDRIDFDLTDAQLGRVRVFGHHQTAGLV